MIKTDKQEKEKSCGFTLIEMVVVLIIAGIVTGMVFSALGQQRKLARQKLTKERLERVVESIRFYEEQNGELPCPAPLTSDMTTAAPDLFGREVTTGNACNATAPGAAPNGTFRSGGVLIGTVPTRDLGLPDEYMLDGWDSRLTYAVTENLTYTEGYSANEGVISLLDFNNNEITPSGNGSWIVLSHGIDAKGAYTRDGVAAAQACTVNTLDDSNCDNGDAVFRAGILQQLGDVTNVNHFDDSVEHGVKGAGGSGSASTITVQYTSARYRGGFGGLRGANVKCRAEFPGSYFCPIEDFLRGDTGPGVAPWAWVHSDGGGRSGLMGRSRNPSSHVYSTSPCYQWDTSGITITGTTTDSLATCNTELSLACCSQ